MIDLRSTYSICQSCFKSSYLEHFRIFELIQRQFWQRVPSRLIKWNLDDGQNEDGSDDSENSVGKNLCCEELQRSILQGIIFHPVTEKYSPSNKYIVQFLKAYIDKIETAEESVVDELIEFCVSLMATLDTKEEFSSGVCFQTYVVGDREDQRITLKTNVNLISKGTTGLRPWKASMIMTDFVLKTKEIVQNKRVLELGSGVGLLGLVCGFAGAKEVLLTDTNKDVLEVLRENALINKNTLGYEPEVDELDWDAVGDEIIEREFDVIVGTDLVYDPSIIPILVKAVEKLVVNKNQMVYLASTVRSPDTFNLFTKLISSSKTLVGSHMDISDIKRQFIFQNYEDNNSGSACKLSIIALKQLGEKKYMQ